MTANYTRRTGPCNFVTLKNSLVLIYSKLCDYEYYACIGAFVLLFMFSCFDFPKIVNVASVGYVNRWFSNLFSHPLLFCIFLSCLFVRECLDCLAHEEDKAAMEMRYVDLTPMLTSV